MEASDKQGAVRLSVNGEDIDIAADPDMPLLYVLRDELGLKGARFGCGQGTCGACTVLLDGSPVMSCDTPLSSIAGRSVETIEGFAQATPDHPLLRALVDAQAAQCGYCLTGITMAAKALLDVNPRADSDEIRAALNGNLCRCGTHLRILRAVQAAGTELAEGTQ